LFFDGGARTDVAGGTPAVPVTASVFTAPILLMLTAASVAGAEDLPRSGRPPVPLVADIPVAAADWPSLTRIFDRLGYDLAAVRAGTAPVPRLVALELPPDLSEMADSKARKTVFTRLMLPIILRINADIAADRARLHVIRARIREDAALGPLDAAWLAALGERYEVADPVDDIEQLYDRVDIVPPSLALAQAAVESGWGTSDLAHRQNGIFGQTTGRGPTDYVAFGSLAAAVAAYANNLNTHDAYRVFRIRRARMRDQGQAPDGNILSYALPRYAGRGVAYALSIGHIVRSNHFQPYDGAVLAPEDWTRAQRPE
jgi:Bax protein